MTNAKMSITSYLNPRLFSDRKLLNRMSSALQRGRLVVVRNAFSEQFAELIHQSLDRPDLSWKLFEGYEAPAAGQQGLLYHYHTIPQNDLFPTQVKACNVIFDDPRTKKFMERIAKRDCSGKVVFNATWYLPGDYASPHNDKGYKRQVAYVWHLTKDWRKNWGGDFFWLKGPKVLFPSFNTLVLFPVSQDSWHLVNPVSPYAQSKRFAISGWWVSKTEEPALPKTGRRVAIPEEKDLFFV